MLCPLNPELYVIHKLNTDQEKRKQGKGKPYDKSLAAVTETICGILPRNEGSAVRMKGHQFHGYFTQL